MSASPFKPKIGDLVRCTSGAERFGHREWAATGCLYYVTENFGNIYDYIQVRQANNPNARSWSWYTRHFVPAHLSLSILTIQ